jgi:hypothetical protein
MVLSVNSEEMIQKEFIINKELEDLMPKMQSKEFNDFKANVKSVGLKRAIEVLPDKTIVDGHTRYRACKELGIPDYKIPFNVLKLACIQEALEHAENINRNRRHLNAFQKGTSALKVYGNRYPDKDIASKIGMDAGNLSKIKKLNNMLKLVRTNVPDKATKYEERLNSGDIGFDSALKELECAENIDNITAILDGKYGDVTKKIGIEKAKAFKAEMEAKYLETKYDKKSLKALNEDIARVVHPELYEKVEKGYQEKSQPVIAKIYKLEEEFGDNITIFNVTSENGYDDADNYIKSLKGTGKLMGMIAFFNLTKEMVHED